MGHGSEPRRRASENRPHRHSVGEAFADLRSQDEKDRPGRQDRDVDDRSQPVEQAERDFPPSELDAEHQRPGGQCVGAHGQSPHAGVRARASVPVVAEIQSEPGGGKRGEQWHEVVHEAQPYRDGIRRKVGTYTLPVATTTLDEDRIARLQRVGRYLIFAGVLVWGVWLAVKLGGGEPNVQYFLPFHLAGVIPGSILSRWGAIQRFLKRR